MLDVARGAQVLLACKSFSTLCQSKLLGPCLGPAWARDDMMTRASHAVLLLNYNF